MESTDHNKSYIFYLLFIVLFHFTKICSYGQQLTIYAQADTLSNEITSYVTLINIPEGSRARFQQRLFSQAKLINLSSYFLHWDTADNILTIITPKYPKIDTLSFQFVCKANSLPDVLSWGEAALMYEDNNGIVRKIATPVKQYIVRNNNPDIDSLKVGMYYIQISASKAVQDKKELAKHVHLQSEHVILEEITEAYYKYFIGNFTSKEHAAEQLKYYKKYVSDAFVVYK